MAEKISAAGVKDEHVAGVAGDNDLLPDLRRLARLDHQHDGLVAKRDVKVGLGAERLRRHDAAGTGDGARLGVAFLGCFSWRAVGVIR